MELESEIGIQVDLQNSTVIACEEMEDTTFLIEIENSEDTAISISFIAYIDTLYDDPSGFRFSNEMIINAIKISLMEN